MNLVQNVLYFVKNIENTIRQTKAVLQPGGQMAIFSSTLCCLNYPNLDSVLERNGFSFQKWDFSENELALLKRWKQVARELKKDLLLEEKENMILYKMVKEETRELLKLYAAGRGSRLLYLAKLP